MPSRTVGQAIRAAARQNTAKNLQNLGLEDCKICKVVLCMRADAPTCPTLQIWRKDQA
jgi:hypothetical protein